MSPFKQGATTATDTDAELPCVLVVDDEPGIRKLLTLALREGGFSVLSAPNGAKAVELYRQRPDVALVLLDVLMAPPDGPETLALLRKFDPNVRCCFMSGSTGGYTTEQLLSLGATHLFPKPFRSLADLVVRLHEVVKAK